MQSVCRLPKESQIDAAILEEMRGLPWRPRDGHRKARRETSEVVVVSAPLLAHPAPEDAGDTVLPVTATAENGAHQHCQESLKGGQRASLTNLRRRHRLHGRRSVRSGKFRLLQSQQNHGKLRG